METVGIAYEAREPSFSKMNARSSGQPLKWWAAGDLMGHM
jgi:hypothetical protein